MPLLSASTELTAKRVITLLLGLVLLTPLALIAVQFDPVGLSRDDAVSLAFIFLGPVIGPVLLSHWDQWPRLRPGDRAGLILLSAIMIPVLLFVIVGAEHIEDTAFILGPIGLGITALWWSLSGYRLEVAPRAASSTTPAETQNAK